MVLKMGTMGQEPVAMHEYIERFDEQGRLIEILACERFRSVRLNVLVDCVTGQEQVHRMLDEKGAFVLGGDNSGAREYDFGDLETVDLPLAGTAVSGMAGVTELVAYRKIRTRFDKSGEIDLVVTQERFLSGLGHEWREDHSGGSLAIETSLDACFSQNGGLDYDANYASFDGKPSIHKKWPCGQEEMLYQNEFGAIHRDGEEPAHIKVDAKGNEERSYYVDGQYHRPGKRPVVEKIKAKPLPGFTP